jgi:hypothetical protein
MEAASVGSLVIFTIDALADVQTKASPPQRPCRRRSCGKEATFFAVTT